MKNLDLEVDEELLKEKFSEFGKIVSLVISKDDNGTSRGFGFVNFESPDDARRAMETMNGSQLGGLFSFHVVDMLKRKYLSDFLSIVLTMIYTVIGQAQRFCM